jgi:aspartate/methionine/tyrosine aminotransferase
MNFGTIEHFDWLKTKAHGYIDLASSGVPSPANLAALGVDLGDIPLTGDNHYGYPPLKEWLAGRFGTTPDHIAITPGGSGANFAVMSILLGGSPDVAHERPGYQPLSGVAEAVLGRPARFFDRKREQRFTIDPDLPFRDGFKPKVVIVTNPHNPSCIFEPFSKIVSLAERVDRYGGWVLVDEIFLPFIRGKEFTTAALLHDRIIATGSLTKAWGLSGLRLGWAISTPEIIHRIQRASDYFHAVQPLMTEILALRILAGSTGDRLLEAARVRAETNRPILIESMKKWGKLSITEPDAGVIMVGYLPNGVVADEPCARLLERENVLVTPGRFFGNPDAIRIGYPSPTEVLVDGLRRLTSVFDQFV